LRWRKPCSLLWRRLRDNTTTPATQPRVVSLSSTLHKWSREDPSETLHVMPCDADLTLPLPRDATTLLQHFAATTDSKFALLLFTQELNRVFHQSQAPIRAVAVNPGAVYSDIWRFLPYPLRHYIVEPGPFSTRAMSLGRLSVAASVSGLVYRRIHGGKRGGCGRARVCWWTTFWRRKGC